jgi:hypothetical protein
MTARSDVCRCFAQAHSSLITAEASSTIGFYNVSATAKRWKAQSSYDSKQDHFGCFDTKQEAALAY